MFGFTERQRQPFLPFLPFLPFIPCAGLLLTTDRRDAVKTSVCEGNFRNPLFTLFCQSSKHLEMVSKWSSDYEQMWIPLTFHWQCVDPNKYTNI